VLTPQNTVHCKGALQRAATTWQLCQRIRVLTSVTQCTAKERCNERTTTMAAVSEDQSADFCNTVHCRSAATSEQHGSCVRGSEADLCNTVHRSERCKKRRNMGSCQRIRVLTLCNTVHRKGTLQEAQQHGQLCQRIRVLTPLQHSDCKGTLQEAQQTWQLSEDHADSSATQCTVLNAARSAAMAAVPEDQSADLCNTVHCKGTLQERKQTWAAVPEDQEC
jgi:hypothetical protein